MAGILLRSGAGATPDSVPTLAIYGSRDVNVDARGGGDTLRAILGSRGEVLTFAGASHELRSVDPDGDDDFEWLYSKGFAEGYFDAMTRWLRARTAH